MSGAHAVYGTEKARFFTSVATSCPASALPGEDATSVRNTFSPLSQQVASATEQRTEQGESPHARAPTKRVRAPQFSRSFRASSNSQRAASKKPVSNSAKP